MEVDTVQVDKLMGWLNQQQDFHLKTADAARKVSQTDLAVNEAATAEIYGTVFRHMEQAFAGATASKPAAPPQADLSTAKKSMAALQELASYGKVAKLLPPGVRSYYAGLEMGLDTALALLKTAER